MCTVVVTVMCVLLFVLHGVSGWEGYGLGFTNPVETGGVLDVYMCLGCGGVGSG